MKKVLITGHKGYIGQHLWKLIKDTRPDIYLYGLDNDEKNITSYFGDINSLPAQKFENGQPSFHTIIHLAALVRVGESVENPWLYYNTNINGTKRLLNHVNCHNFIFASTGAASNPDSPYGYSKRVAEDIVKQMAYDYTIFRFYNVIGTEGFPPTNPEGLMLNLMNARETGKFTIFGDDYNTKDGTCVREYVHVMDICRALVKAIDKPSRNIENLAYGDPRTTKEIVKTFMDVNQVTCNIDYGPRRKGDLEACYLDNPSSYMERNYTYEQMLKV
jgi:UDP-glucose 4-epimerase